MNPHIFFEIILTACFLLMVVRNSRLTQKLIQLERPANEQPLWPDAISIHLQIEQATTMRELQRVCPDIKIFEVCFNGRPIFSELHRDMLNAYNRKADELDGDELSSELLRIPTLYLYEQRKN
jgi:hypothetical protein